MTKPIQYLIAFCFACLGAINLVMGFEMAHHTNGWFPFLAVGQMLLGAGWLLCAARAVFYSGEER